LVAPKKAKKSLTLFWEKKMDFTMQLNQCGKGLGCSFLMVKKGTSNEDL